MVYRFSWLAGTAAILFALFGLNGLLRPTPEGTTRWQFIVFAALVLGATITWTALTYRAHPVIVIGLNLVGLVIAIARIAAPETTAQLLPTSETWSVVSTELDRAIGLIRTGIEPVQATAGIVIVLAAVFWTVGVLLTWGLMRGHPYVALVPPLVLSLQFATMDRGRTSAVRMTFFLAIVAASIVAITMDERDQSAGRMAGKTRRPGIGSRLAPSAAGLLGITLLFSVFTTGLMAGMVPYDGVLPWRSATGLASDIYGGVAYNPFIGIQQSLVTQSNTPVFLAEITGDVPGDEVYFRLVTMETYNGGQFFADKPQVVDLDSRPWQDPGNAFAGPTGDVTTTIQIERLRMNWLPETYVPVAFFSPEDIADQVRVRQADGSLILEGNVSYEGMTYTVESEVPRPDIAVLATGNDGQLSPAFEFAASDGQDVPEPVVVVPRDEPTDIDRYLELPDDLDSGIAAEARQLTANLTTNYEIGLALESWFHSDAFAYNTNIEPGHGATDLAAWLLDPDSTNYHVGYCENFATAMAIMARTLEVPSRVVLGFTPGEPTQQENVYVVRDRNAHAWVELWMPTQGWVRFDPTPRGDAINPSTFGDAEEQLGFAITEYLEIEVEPIDVQGSALPPPRLPEDFEFPLPGSGGAESTGGGFDVPTWVKTVAPLLLVLILLIGGIPTVKWWQRVRRMRRLENGDISAAWEDIVARLTDLGDAPSAAATPRQIAYKVDDAMVPLATVYGRSIYGPEHAVADRHVNTAVESLEQTRARLLTRHSVTQRLVAAYRPSSIVPDRARKIARKMKFNGSRNNGS